MDLDGASSRLPAIAIGIAIVWILSALLRPQSKLPDIPWVGKSSNLPGAKAWATFASFANRRKWFAEGYNKWSKLGKSYIVPHPLGSKHITLPPGKLSWLLEQHDSVASAADFHYDVLSGKWAWTDPNVQKVLFHEHVIHKYIVRKDSKLLAGLWDDTVHSIDEIWGTSENWKDVKLLNTVEQIVLRIVNRALVGLPLCRNKEYLRSTESFTTNVLLCTFLTQLTPWFLRDLVGYTIGAPNHWHYRKCAKFTMPLIKERLTMIQDKNSSVDIPEDYITWHITLAMAEGKKKELEPDFIARSLMALEFAAIKTPAATMTRTLLDVLGSDPARGYLDGIREEVESNLKASDGAWTKASLHKLVKTDSAIRESMRMTSLLFALGRKVMQPQGIYNEEEGWTAPQGSYLTINAADRHLDPEVYPNPQEYDAFRFSRLREEEREVDGSVEKGASWLRKQNLGMTSTSKDFLAFGHGRHACPGRFLVEQMLKMFFAHIVTKYEIEHLPEMPANFVLGPINVPPPSLTIRIRRKVVS